MNPLIRMYDFHKKEFSVEDNKFLRLFEELLSEPACSVLECSSEISPKGIHGARLRLGYQKEDIRKGLDAIYGFLSGIEAFEKVLLNRMILDRIVDKKFNLSKTLQMGIGLDYREEICDSKVKCYFMLSEYPEKVNQVLSTHPAVDFIDYYLIHDEFVFGIDMYFDGRTGVEIYPLFEQRDLRDAALLEKLDLRGKVLRLIVECIGMHISFTGAGKRVLHFHPRSPSRFIHLIGDRRLSLLYSKIQILRFLLDRWKIRDPFYINIVFREDEIMSENIQNINLQCGLVSGP